jgi:hypothetical protein
VKSFKLHALSSYAKLYDDHRCHLLHERPLELLKQLLHVQRLLQKTNYARLYDDRFHLLHGSPLELLKQLLHVQRLLQKTSYARLYDARCHLLHERPLELLKQLPLLSAAVAANDELCSALRCPLSLTP